MSNIPKYAAYGIGAVSLLVGSFVTFSALSGTPMNEMKAVGGLFPESVSAEEEEAEDGEPVTPEEERNSDVRSPRQVLESSSTPLGAFALQDPFSAEELRNLERQLQIKIDEVARRARELEKKERELELERQHLEDRISQFETLKTSLIESKSENIAQAEELQRSNAAFDEKQAEVEKELSKLFEDGKAKDMAKILLKTYSYDKAARVLVHLDDDRRREIFGALYQADEDEGASYYRAYERFLESR